VNTFRTDDIEDVISRMHLEHHADREWWLQFFAECDKEQENCVVRFNPAQFARAALQGLTDAESAYERLAVGRARGY
jgi:hypothetical protein